MAQRTKEEIQHIRDERDKNFNLIDFDQNGGNIFEAYVVRISFRGFHLSFFFLEEKLVVLIGFELLI